MAYLMKPEDPTTPTDAERVIVFDVSTKKLSEFKTIRFESKFIDVYRGDTQITVTNENFDLYHPSFDYSSSQKQWTYEEVESGAVHFKYKLDNYK